MLLKDQIILHQFQRILFGICVILEFKYNILDSFSMFSADVVMSKSTVENACIATVTQMKVKFFPSAWYWFSYIGKKGLGFCTFALNRY